MKKAIKDGLRPEPLITVTEWADKFRKLDGASAAEPGQYRSSRTPYLKYVMDWLSEMCSYQEVIVIKGAQLGFTEAALNWIGYTIQISPCPILLVEPTKDVVELVSKTRVQTMIDATPELSDKVKPTRSRDSGNTLTKKEFPGGILRMVGANSAAGLRNMPAKRIILDEVDAYPLDLDGEGDPIDLARKRTATFAKRKIFILSTPTIKGLSTVDRLFESTDKHYMFLPCPHCGGLQHLVWEQLSYDYDPESQNVSNVKYICIHCQEGIEERYKTEMLEKGIPMPTDPAKSNNKKIGLSVNSMYSPLGWLSWAEMAKDYEDAIAAQQKGDETKLKTFYNVSLAMAYESKGDKPEWKQLYDNRLDYPINRIPNNDIAFLTAGVDIQKDRIELEIVGWAKGKKSYSIDYRVLQGMTAGEESPVWNKLAEVLKEEWMAPDGNVFTIKQMFVDSGYNSTEVYAFCNKYGIGQRVLPVKGSDTLSVVLGSPKAVNVSKNNKAIGKTKVWQVGISIIKAELYGWLRIPEHCSFPQYPEEYFKGLTAEELVITKNKNNKDVQAWVKKYRRNEPLDCRVYARAAANLVGMDSMKDEQWERIRSIVSVRTKSNNREKRKSSYL